MYAAYKMYKMDFDIFFISNVVFFLLGHIRLDHIQNDPSLCIMARHHNQYRITESRENSVKT